MKEILPHYGVEVIEIPRMKYNTRNVISASEVRNRLEKSDWAEIKKLVPDITYAYLEKNYYKLRKKIQDRSKNEQTKAVQS